MGRRWRVGLAGLGAVLALACATQAPKVGWENPERPGADLEADRKACVAQAMDAEFPSAGRDRAEAAYRGNLFLECMSGRGWQQVLVED
jgi:hypothetical protein